MNSEVHSSLMFLWSFGLHLNVLNLTHYSNMPSRNHLCWKLNFWSDLQLLCSSLHICTIDWCDEKFNFWPTDISLSPAKENWLEDEIAKKGFKITTEISLAPYYMDSRMRKKDRSALCPYDSVHQLSLPYAYQWTNQWEACW